MTDVPGPSPSPPATPSPAPRPAATTPTATTATGTTLNGSVTDGNEPDWTDQVTDLIVDTVDNVRNKTTGPVLGVARASVYAVVILVLVVPIVVLLLAGLVRLINWALPGDVWIAYLALGIVFTLAGVVCWSRRPSTAA